ncbi:MAG: glycosyltransferase family 4 protein [Burkholderiaceae bacterium]|nr:glycosyltransferase family 4 protein [Burkholderiaceae bacterium]
MTEQQAQKLQQHSRAATLPAGKCVVMMGPGPDGRGGMASVSAAYRAAGLFQRWDVACINTLSTGGIISKLIVAAQAWLQLAGLLWRGQVGLVHIHVASGFSFWRKALYVWTLRVAGVPFILHLHGGNFVEFYRASSALAQRFIRTSFGRAARVMVLSQTWVGRMAPIVDRNACVAIGNPVATWPAKQREPRPVRRFLFLGRFERDKGLAELLAAFSEVFRLHPDVELLLGGEGDVASIEQVAAKLPGLRAAIKLLGWVGGDAKRQAFDAADVFVLPSYIEGLPVAMLEAMSCVMPVVVTPVGSIPEVVTNRISGLLVAPQDVNALTAAMLSLVQEPGLAERLGQEGKAIFDRSFDAQVVCEQVERLYAELLTQPARKA